MELKETIDKLLIESEGKLAILLKDIDTDEVIYSLRSSERIVSASIIKVAIMLAMMEAIREGRFDLDQELFVSADDILYDTEVFTTPRPYRIEELLYWMIITSDNTATNVLIKNLKMSYINEYIQGELNARDTVLRRYMLDFKARKDHENYSSQRDMCTIFGKLFKGEILNAKLREKCLTILRLQRAKDQLLRYVYAPVDLCHKTGELDYLNHDVGVLITDKRRIYIGVSVFDCKTKDGDRKIVGKIGKAAIEHFIK